jgi:hypothetical protein
MGVDASVPGLWDGDETWAAGAAVKSIPVKTKSRDIERPGFIIAAFNDGEGTRPRATPTGVLPMRQKYPAVKNAPTEKLWRDRFE